MSLDLQPLGFENAWVRAVDRARRQPPAWALALAGLLAALGSVALARLAADTLVQKASGPPLLAVYAAVTVVAFLPLWALALGGAAFEGRSVWRAGGGALDAGLGLLLGAGLYLLAVGLVTLSGHAAAGGEGRGLGAVPGVLAGLALVAFQAGAEEVFFRGWLQPVFCARWGVWVGVLATSALFALLHLAGGERSPLALLNLLLGGLAFGLLALRTGGLWAPFAAHLAWNWLEACVLGLDPNPGVGPTGSVLDLDLTGAGLWSGGADAMNGSFGATLALAAGVVGLVAWKARRTEGFARA